MRPIDKFLEELGVSRLPDETARMAKERMTTHLRRKRRHLVMIAIVTLAGAALTTAIQGWRTGVLVFLLGALALLLEHSLLPHWRRDRVLIIPTAVGEPLWYGLIADTAADLGSDEVESFSLSPDLLAIADKLRPYHGENRLVIEYVGALPPALASVRDARSRELRYVHFWTHNP